MAVDINCDMGESFALYRLGDDDALMPLITEANIACGFHGSDPNHMRHAVRSAKQHGVRIGAHVALPDLSGFGRREMVIDRAEMANIVLYQIGALNEFLAVEGLSLSHVKPHGALYGAAWRDEKVARAIAHAANTFGVPLMGMSGTGQGKWYQEEGVDVIWETYVDLDYNDEGEIVITRQHEPVTAEAAAAQALRAARDGQVQAMSGKLIDVKCETICVHSDTPGAVEIARAVKDAIASVA